MTSANRVNPEGLLRESFSFDRETTKADLISGTSSDDKITSSRINRLTNPLSPALITTVNSREEEMAAEEGSQKTLADMLFNHATDLTKERALAICADHLDGAWRDLQVADLDLSVVQ